MPQFFIGMYQPTGEVPPPEYLAPIMRKLGVLTDELVEAGALVFSNGFDQSVPASVVTALPGACDGASGDGGSADGASDGEGADGDGLAGDSTSRVRIGTVLPGELQLGGFTVVDVADLETARDIAARIADITHLALEVRAFADRS